MSMKSLVLDPSSPDAFIREVVAVFDADEESGPWEEFFTDLFQSLWVTDWGEEQSSPVLKRYWIDLSSTEVRAPFWGTQDWEFPRTWTIQLHPFASEICFLGSSRPKMNGHPVHAIRWMGETGAWHLVLDRGSEGLWDKVRRFGLRTFGRKV